ncbi:bifunctional glutamate--cysteine ligase GshA/glutathione synthetase GshB [Spirochaetota bacterium]
MKESEYILQGYEDLEISTQILIRDALARGIKVDILDRSSNFIRLEKDGKIEYVKEASKTSMDSYVTFHLMENKVVSKKILEENEFNVPHGRDFVDHQRALEFYKKNLDKKIVIKPTTANFGLGITIVEKNSQIDIVTSAIRNAFSHSDSIIIEEFIDGDELRFLVIDYKTIAVCKRVPANIIGDGESNIRELVEIKNRDLRRGTGHVRPLEKIQLEGEEKQVLRDYGYTIDSIPGKNEQVYLRLNSNISTGGDSYDVTDSVHDYYKEIASKASKAVVARICGVDIIANDYTKAGEYSILELNFNPVLYIHDYPYEGKNRKVGVKILDLLGY